jgi:hypothetical protein
VIALVYASPCDLSVDALGKSLRETAANGAGEDLGAAEALGTGQEAI